MEEEEEGEEGSNKIIHWLLEFISHSTRHERDDGIFNVSHKYFCNTQDELGAMERRLFPFPLLLVISLL